jgi:NifU-like protein involved in Fe-S cluster formation
MTYSDEVQRRFGRPGHVAGPDDSAERVAGRAGRRATGTVVEFLVAVRGGILSAVRFRAYGCPHTIAAADLAAEWLEGRPLAALGEVDAHRLAARLGVPVEKLGRLLVIEDAARDCLARCRADAAPHED